MNYLDFIILIPAVWFGFKGAKNGLIRELISLTALILGIWATFKFTDFVASLFSNSPILQKLSFVIVFIAVLILVHLVGRIFEKIISFVFPTIINNILGLLFGIGKVVIVFSVIFYFINCVDTKKVIFKQEHKENSFCYKYVEPAVPYLLLHKDKIKGLTSDKEDDAEVINQQ